LEYIGGGYDGLVLKKQLTSMLRGFRSFDQDSKRTVKAEINHEMEIFITNIDNTSDRERVKSSLKVKVYDKELDCVIFKFNDEISQFYIYASSEKFLSNTKAVESIKYNNTEELVKNFVNDLTRIKSGCLK
jgi:adenylosuccinate synthase